MVASLLRSQFAWRPLYGGQLSRGQFAAASCRVLYRVGEGTLSVNEGISIAFGCLTVQTCFLKMAKGKNRNRNRTVFSSSENTNSYFKESDRKLLKDINISVKELREEISFLKLELKKTKEVALVKRENAQLKKAINLNINFYSHDELEIYRNIQSSKKHSNLRSPRDF